MLVLSRQLGESICIGANITLVVTQIDGDRVQMGTEAPKSIPIFRGELNGKSESRNGARATAPLGKRSVKDS
jgi:carbon storage regulator